MNLAEQVQLKIDTKTKPLGALGELEQVAKQICMVQQTLSPEIIKPHIFVFAGDHGIAHEGVSAYPQDVTWQMVNNFVEGGAAINVFSRQHGITLKVVDAGVNYDFPQESPVIPLKVAKGTQSFLNDTAMSPQQLDQALDMGAGVIAVLAQTHCNLVGFGEMGIANTSAASAIICQLTGFSLNKMTGRGTGLNDEQLQHKVSVLEQAFGFHGALSDPKDILQTYGGFEIAQMVGAMLEAFNQNMLILVDGFIASSAYLVASRLEPNIARNAIFCHESQEPGHKKLLELLDVKPLLKLEMRLGEGSGCALAFPLIQSAVAFINEMASFDEAGVSET